jgi:phosphopantothenoylcysteine decarboxylase/phosphopantothenate--cysteine ligase
VTAAASQADVVIMAAAVADYTPSAAAPGKLTKAEAPLTLTLTRTKDILAELGAARARSGSTTPVLVGFAAETDDVLVKAREKRARKLVDLVVANDVSRPDRGFDTGTNAVTLVGEEGEESVALQSKDRIAAAILDRVERLLRVRAAASSPR